MKFESQLIGHAVPQQILYQALTSHKMGHAYLFTGEDKIGKRTVALAVAKTLLCPSAIPFCGKCPSCLKGNQKMHPDLFEISPEGLFIKLNQIRQIQDQMSLHPSLSSRKVFILDDADRLNPEASNAFLKSLEEPPEDTHFILVTSRPQALLSTILSRCQQIRFSTPPREELVNFLMRNRKLSTQDARHLAKRSEGRVGVAITYDLESLDQEDLRYFMLIDPETLNSPGKLFQLSEELSRDADHFRKTVEWILSFIRDMIYWKTCPEPDLLILDRHREKIEQFSSQFSFEKLNRTFLMLLKVEKLIQRNINRPLALENVLFHLRPFDDRTQSVTDMVT